MDLVDWFHRVLFVGKAFGFRGRVHLVGFAADGNPLMAGGAVKDEAHPPRDVRGINAQSLLRALDAESFGSASSLCSDCFIYPSRANMRFCF